MHQMGESIRVKDMILNVFIYKYDKSMIRNLFELYFKEMNCFYFVNVCNIPSFTFSYSASPLSSDSSAYTSSSACSP